MKIKQTLKIIALITIMSISITDINAQVYVKLNALYAAVGVINPSIEFAISPKSTIQSEIVASPWKTINGKHATFGMFMSEYRRYFKEHNNGWYLGGNIGMNVFDISKPYLDGISIKFQDRYCKGYGFMFGVSAGYERKLGDRWLLDAYFGFSWISSFYNGYNMNGEIQMNPHRPVQPKYPDPFNGSSEWMPNKIGVSFGYLIFDPKK